MKYGNNIFIILVAFFVGALVSYIFCQITLLEIDPKVNVAGSLISTLTIIIGLYIAISLKKIQTRSSNLHSYVQNKIDKAWDAFSSFAQQILIKDKEELTQITKATKEVSMHIASLKKIFVPFKLDGQCLIDLENQIDTLENLLTTQPIISPNIVNYSNIKSSLSKDIDKIHNNFASAFIIINKIS